VDSGVTWSPSIVVSGIEEVVTTLMAGGTVPLPSFTEAVEIAGELITYAVVNLLRGDSLQAQFDSVSAGLLPILALTGNGASAQSQYVSYMASSGLPADELTLLQGLGYNALCSFFFDPGGTPDLSGYDGTVCGGSLADIIACTDFVTASVFRSAHNYQALVLPPSYGPDTQFIAGDYEGWSFEIVDGPSGEEMGVYYYTTGDTEATVGGFLPGSGVHTFGPTHAIGFFSVHFAEDLSGPFTIRICPAE
jgi:hypothetical protein